MKSISLCSHNPNIFHKREVHSINYFKDFDWKSRHDISYSYFQEDFPAVVFNCFIYYHASIPCPGAERRKRRSAFVVQYGPSHTVSLYPDLQSDGSDKSNWYASLCYKTHVLQIFRRIAFRLFCRAVRILMRIPNGRQGDCRPVPSGQYFKRRGFLPSLFLQ